MHFIKCISLSRVHGQQARLDFFAMFKMLGPPTYFITLSADDMNWFDLMCVLSKRNSMSRNDDQVRELSPGERSRLLCSYPVICSTAFLALL